MIEVIDGYNDRVAIEKVSFEQFKKDWADTFSGTDKALSDDKLKKVYDELKVPRRATKGSAGYDFFSPLDFTLAPGQTIKFPTGMRAVMCRFMVLLIVPRSGQGFKYRLQLDNTIGVIDSDYAHSDNEGHIFMKLTNDSRSGKTIKVNFNDAVAQGIFTDFYVTDDDTVSDVRNGGFGSTGA